MTQLTRSALRFLALVAMLAPAAPARAQTALTPPAPAATAKPPSLIADVRAAIAKGDFAGAEQLIGAFRTAKGTTPEALEALSWLGRGALAASQLDRAENYALETYDLCVDALQTRKMDDEPRLPIAIGAAIEVRAHVHAERGARADAIYLLQQELAAYRTTSIRARIQKNINLLSLEGKPAPALDTAEYLGAVAPGAVAALKGKPVVLFFWAHWCPDCKVMSTVLEALLAKYRDQGLTVVAPTQRYGYVAKRAPAAPAEEMAYMAQVRDQVYPWLAREWVPVSEENLKNYGASTTPTVVLVDRAGIVRLYHPGQMTMEQIEPHIKAIIDSKGNSAQDAAAVLAQAERDRRHFHTASALRGFEQAAADPRVAADAWLGIGRIRAFRGWQAEGAFPGWHEEVDQRPLALAAYRRAAELRPTWAEPHVAIGEALLLDGRAAEARAAFEQALALTAGHPGATRGVARAAGRPVADPDGEAMAAIDAAMKAGQSATQVSLARAFITARPDSPRIVDAYTRLLSGLQGWHEAPVAEIDAAIDARLAWRPDPLAYSAAVNLLRTRGVRLDRARALALEGLAAGERFITENEPSYKLDGKVQASRDRNRAQFSDLLGWTAFLQGDLATAGQRLDEAARYSNGNDFLTQFHRGQLARHTGETEIARERFFDALSLETPPPLAPLRQTAEDAITAIYLKEGASAPDAATSIARELERRRDERRRALLATAVGRPLPKLPTTSVAGTPVDLLAERGNVTLLNFFAAW